MNIYKWILAFSILMLVFGACTNPVQEKSHIEIKNDSTTRDSSTEANTVDEGSIEPYREVDSLITVVNENYTLKTVFKLDSICVRSDGDLSEKYYEVSKQLFEKHLSDFSKYLTEYPGSCLKVKLIESLSADLSVYEDKERVAQMEKQEGEMLSKAKKLNLSSNQIQVIEDIFRNLNPGMFD